MSDAVSVLDLRPGSDESEAAASRLAPLLLDDRFAARRADLERVHRVVADSTLPSGGWEHADLIRAFPPESTIGVKVPRQLEAVVGVLTALSVFIPIAWTWYSLTLASSAYRGWLAQEGTVPAGEGARPSFLQLWVEGFGGRLGPLHTLTSVAFVSVSLIVLAAVLVVWHRSLDRRAEEQEQAAFLAAEAELVGALTDAQRAIGVSLLKGSRSTEEMVRTSVEQLLRAHELTRASAAELKITVAEMKSTLESAGTALDGAVSKVDAVGERAIGVAEATAKAADGLSGAFEAAGREASTVVDRLSSEFDAGAARQRQALDAASQAHVQLLETTARELLRTVEDLNTAHTQMTQDLLDKQEKAVADGLDRTAAVAGDVAAAVDRVAHAADSVARENKALVAAAQGLPTQVGDSIQVSQKFVEAAAVGLAQQTTETTEKLQSLLANVGAQIVSISHAIERNSSAVQGQVTELTNTREAIQDMNGRLNGHALGPAPAPGSGPVPGSGPAPGSGLTPGSGPWPGPGPAHA